MLSMHKLSVYSFIPLADLAITFYYIFMYKIGKRKRNVKKYFYALLGLAFLSALVIVGIIIFLNFQPSKATEINNIAEKNNAFDPTKSNNSLKVDTAYYTMELPSDWKQLSVNKDPRYSSIEWGWDAKTKNRSLEIYVDNYPLNKPFNKIVPVSIQGNVFTLDTMSENCSKFTSKTASLDLHVQSKWQDVSFICDLDNTIDNIIGIGTTSDGVILPMTGPQSGAHKYMFVYTDRSIPDSNNPLITALQSFRVK